MSKKSLLIILAFSIIFNLTLVLFIFNTNTSQTNQTDNQYSSYPLLSPRIFVQNQNERLINFVTLRSELAKYHSESKKNFGFYFEYLPSGVSIGINDRENFVLASLLKTPLAMGVFKKMEEGKISKSDILTLRQEDIDQAFGDLWKKGAGTQMTVYDALKYTLSYSDNTAKNMLFSAIPEGTMENVFESLDIPQDISGNNAVVTPKNYSSILRSLYLSSYLDEADSNEILNLLTQSPFNDKMAAGIPSNIKVAHKIGVHEGSIKGREVYTDCGIVYVPRRPYILCIMVKEDEETTTKIMKDVSSIIYNYINSYESHK